MAANEIFESSFSEIVCYEFAVSGKGQMNPPQSVSGDALGNDVVPAALLSHFSAHRASSVGDPRASFLARRLSRQLADR